MELPQKLVNSKNNYTKILIKIINLIISNGIKQYIIIFIKKLNKFNFLDNIQNDKDFINYTNKIIKIYHYHSSIEINANHNLYKTNNLIPTKFKISNNIGTIKLYSFSTYSLTKTQIDNYIKNITNFLDNNIYIRGLILDFRKHSGGNMYPLLKALSRFLNNNTLFAWADHKVKFNEQVWCNLINGKVKFLQKRLQTTINTPYPIAIIIGENTTSAGEFVASSFIGDKNVKFFGKNSGGYLSANLTYKVDKYDIHFPNALQTSKNDKFQEYLEADIYTSKPISIAKEWIIRYKK
jgi:C-terminal processing protease CtpA/Prc